MSDNSSFNGLEEWETPPDQQEEVERQEPAIAQDNGAPDGRKELVITPEMERQLRELIPDAKEVWIRPPADEWKKAQDAFWEEKKDREKHLSSDLWAAPSPREAVALVWCEESSHGKQGGWSYYWIAVRFTADQKAFELVRAECDGEIVENYPGRYENWDDAHFAAHNLSKNWHKKAPAIQGSAVNEERDISRNLKLNPWGRAMWERKDPEGPVLVIWQLEPLALFVAGWLPFAGSRCVPSLVQFAYEGDPSRVGEVVDTLGKEAYDAGPSEKMIARAKSIAASYAANGRKGGRPKKDKKTTQAKGTDEE